MNFREYYKKLEEVDISTLSKQELLDKVKLYAKSNNLPTIKSDLDSGSEAQIFETNKKNVLIRITELYKNYEDVEDKSDTDNLELSNEFQYMLDSDIQETGGVAKIYRHTIIEDGGYEYLVTWKERVNENFGWVLREKYSDEEYKEIMYSLSLYDPFNARKNFQNLKRWKETRKLYAAIRAGLPTGDLDSSSNLGIRGRSDIVAFDC